jgi:hypothetical protein
MDGGRTRGLLIHDYRGRMSKSTGSRPVRTALLTAAAVAAALAIRAAVADKGGSYDPSAPAR